MIYLDNGATSFHKPPAVRAAVLAAMARCANPGRGGYSAAMAAEEQVYNCREMAGKLFSCHPEQVIFTSNCTHGLNIAIRSLVKPGHRVVISGFEHNAVTRVLHGLGAELIVAGRRLFDPDDTLQSWEKALQNGAEIAVFTHVSNVFGYILPIYEMARMCREFAVPFVIDGAQSAGILPIDCRALGANYVALPGHKGLLGPQGTGILLCGEVPKPLFFGGTGSNSEEWDMPDFLPDRLEAGTLNVPGIAGLCAGMCYVNRVGLDTIYRREQRQARRCSNGLRKMGFRVFFGENQGGTVSFVSKMDCEDAASKLARLGIAVRAGLHCAPLAHESAGTLATGTVRVSFGHDAADWQTDALLEACRKLR